MVEKITGAEFMHLVEVGIANGQKEPSLQEFMMWLVNKAMATVQIVDAQDEQHDKEASRQKVIALLAAATAFVYQTKPNVSKALKMPPAPPANDPTKH